MPSVHSTSAQPMTVDTANVQVIEQAGEDEDVEIVSDDDDDDDDDNGSSTKNPAELERSVFSTASITWH